jgi:hypothetical protein
MRDDVRYDSLAELLMYIAIESEQAGVWALKHLEKGGPYRKIPKLGARRKSKGPFFSKPPSPDERRRLISGGAGLSLLGYAGDALKEEGRRGLRCEATDPYTGERREINAAEWPLILVPLEAAFDDEGKVFTEVRGISVVAYKQVTGDGLDLERRLPRASTPAPPPIPTVPEESAVKKRTRQQPSRPYVAEALQNLYPEGVPPRSKVSDKKLLAAVTEWIRASVFRELYPEGVGMPSDLKDREQAVREYLKDYDVGWPISMETVRRASGRRIDTPRRRQSN